MSREMCGGDQCISPKELEGLRSGKDEAIALVAKMRRLLRLWSRSTVDFPELRTETEALLEDETGRDLLYALRDLQTERDELQDDRDSLRTKLAEAEELVKRAQTLLTCGGCVFCPKLTEDIDNYLKGGNTRVQAPIGRTRHGYRRERNFWAG